MSTLKKGIKMIYDFHLKGMTKLGTQDHQIAIDLLIRGLTDSTYLSNLTRLATPIEPRHGKTVGE
jgi:hypothetical protein